MKTILRTAVLATAVAMLASCYVEVDDHYRVPGRRVGIDASLNSAMRPPRPAGHSENVVDAPPSGHAPRRVALLTDYGNSDEYVPILKGAILREAPDAPIIDLTHEAPSYGIADGEYLLTEIAKEFPADTVFVAIVDPGVGTSRRALALEAENGMWFIGPDNGLFTGVMDTFGVRETWEIVRTPTGRERSDTFHGRDLFAPIAGKLVAGEDISPFVEKLRNPVRLERVPAPVWTGEALSGTVLRVDKYGNILTNIPAAMAAERARLGPAQDGSVRVAVEAGGRTVTAPFARTYGDVETGALVLVINSRGNLELAVNEGSAAAELGIRTRDTIRISPVR
jgi:S-adenosylmethionine hydrolase